MGFWFEQYKRKAVFNVWVVVKRAVGVNLGKFGKKKKRVVEEDSGSGDLEGLDQWERRKWSGEEFDWLGFVGVNRFVTWKQVNAVSVLEYREEDKIGYNKNKK